MSRLHFPIGLIAAAGVLLIGTGYSQEKKDAKAQPKAATIPVTWGWQKIGLEKDQKQKVQEVITSYNAKIEDLKDKIEKLQEEEYAQAYKLLTDPQKAKVKKPYEAPPKEEKKEKKDKKDAKDPADKK